MPAKAPAECQLTIEILVMTPKRCGALTSDTTLETIRRTAAQVAELATGLLSLALLVLLNAFLLQAIHAEHVADGLLARAKSLIPVARLAVWVVGGDAGAGDGEAANVGTSMRGGVLDVSLVLASLSLVLRTRVSCK